jgi:RNA polymerase sigma factor (sigma-70 family)
MTWDVPDPAIRTTLHTSAIRLPWHRAEPGVAAERAFSQQYERHHQAIYRYCRSILHDEHEAHDALQSTMTKALEAMRAGTLTGDIRPWLFRVAHNECISILRRGARATPLETPDELGADDLARRVDERAAIAQLRADLDDLAERPRTALVLREFSGLSHDEIAAILDTTPGAVKQTIFEARKALLDCQAGRAMSCDDIQRVLSDHDGRTLRSRKVRAHLRDCTACTAFLAAMQERPRQLALLAPALPVAAGSALLGHVLGAGHAAGGIGTAAGTAAGGATLAGSASIAGAGSTVATSVGLKVAAVIAATAVATGGGAVALHDDQPAPSRTSEVPANPAGTAGVGASAFIGAAASNSTAAGAGTAEATRATTADDPAATAATPADPSGADTANGSERSGAADAARDSARGNATNAAASGSSGAGASAAHRRDATAKAKTKTNSSTTKSGSRPSKTAKSSTGASNSKTTNGSSGSANAGSGSGSAKAPAKAAAPEAAAPPAGSSGSSGASGSANGSSGAGGANAGAAPESNPAAGGSAGNGARSNEQSANAPTP